MDIFKIKKDLEFEFNLSAVVKELKIILKYDNFYNYLRNEFIDICLSLIKYKFEEYTHFIKNGSENIKLFVSPVSQIRIEEPSASGFAESGTNIYVLCF